MSPIRVNARARRRIGPFIVNAGARSGVSLSLKLGRVTVPLAGGRRRRGISIDTPGIGSVQVTPGRRQPRAAAAPVELLPVEVGLLRACDPQRGGCGAEPGDVCRTPTKRPAARMHKARRTPNPIPEPTRPLAFRIAFGIGKVLGILVLAFPLPALVVAVVAVATVWIRLS
jgi:hypothetical protein